MYIGFIVCVAYPILLLLIIRFSNGETISPFGQSWRLYIVNLFRKIKLYSLYFNFVFFLTNTSA